MENYFNYFTEIEEHFRKGRAEAVLLSPLDWALIEAWKEQGFPLEAVLAGIDNAFAKFAAGKRSYRKVNSLAYCSQEVFRAVEEARRAAVESGYPATPHSSPEVPFAGDEISGFLSRCAAAVAAASQRARDDGQPVLADELSAAAADLEAFKTRLPASPSGSLEEMERSLTVLEEKVAATLLRATSVETLAEVRAQVERGIAPYRRKMPVPEVESLERRFLKNRLLEHYKIPRLSLFYL